MTDARPEQPRAALAFRPRLDRADAILLRRLHDAGDDVGSLSAARNRPAISIFELFPAEDWLPNHYGKVTRVLWTLVDEIIKPAHFTEDCPPGAHAKSVQVADINARPPAVESRLGYLSLAFDPSQPVMVPCPEVPTALLEPRGRTIEDTRTALHELVWEITERLNIMMPAARAIAANWNQE
jgi:hypothetical protein